MDRSPDSRRRNISAKRLKRGGNGSPEAAQDWWLEEDKRPLANVDVGAELTTQGIIVRAQNLKLLVEEAPEAYKDVAKVVDVVQEAGISRKVARMRPLAVVKG